MKNFIRIKIENLIRWYLTHKNQSLIRDFHPYYDWVVSSNKELFDRIYNRGMEITSTPPSIWRRDRFLNLYSFSKKAAKLDGLVAECGSFRGLSAFMLCQSLKEIDKDFRGEGFHVFDSFEGLPEATEDDINLKTNYKGFFACDIDTVKRNLRDFPGISYHKGWIPDVFKGLPEERYKFVHVDVDLAKPTFDAFNYFWPRLVAGGVIVCDDYGGMYFQGTTKKLDEFCSRNSLQPIILSTGQLVLIK